MKFKMPPRNGKKIFLSAAIPDQTSRFHETADPYCISMAVRELAIILFLNGFQIVCEESPSIDPMIDAICESLGIVSSEMVTRYEKGSQLEVMILKEKPAGAVFMGGDCRVFDACEIFKANFPEAPALALMASGGAAAELARKLNPHAEHDVNFTGIFHRFLAYIPQERLHVIKGEGA